MTSHHVSIDEEDISPRPVGFQSPFKTRMSRRGFLAGAAGSALTIEAAFADSGSVVPKVLRIDLSDEAKTLAVREIPINPKSTQLDSEWCVHAAAFGPKAWFELAVTGDSGASKRLRVRNASFGGSAPVRLDFHFEPKTALLAGKPVVDHWTIGLTTDLWRDPKKPGLPWKSSEIRFADFVSRTHFLRGMPSLAQLKTRFSETFDGRVVAADKPGGMPDLCFFPDCIWGIGGSGPVVTAFGGHASARRFTFGWYGLGEGTPFFLGLANPDDQVMLDQPYFRLGETGGAGVEVVNLSGLSFETRRIDSPLMPGKAQTFAKLSFGACKINLSSEGRKTAEDIPAESLFVTETLLPKAKRTASGKPSVLRHALWGNVGPGNAKAAGAGFELRTFVGRLLVDVPPAKEKTPDPVDPKTQSIQSVKPAPLACAPGPCMETPSGNTKACVNSEDSKQNSDALAAVGDRSGVSTASIWAVFDRAGESGASETRRIAVDLTLLGSNISLSDVSHSSLSFNSADLRLLYEDGRPLDELKSGELPRASASSYVWIGASAGDKASIAQFDLSRATLGVARDSDLVKLRFRFLDLNLVLCPKPVIRPAHADCRVIEVEKGVFRDDRPVLVAEFDPQHVFENAIFRQNVPPPDIQLDTPFTRNEIISSLARFDTSTPDGLRDLIKYREDVRKRKIDAYKRFIAADPSKEDPAQEDPEQQAASKAFEKFSNDFAKEAKRAGLPEPQQIYIGPFALDPDAMALTRQVVQQTTATTIGDAIAAMFRRVDQFITDDPGRSPRILAPVSPGVGDVFFANALRNEAILEQQEPLYGVFRDFYRETRIKALQPADGSAPQSFDRKLIEHLAPSNRPDNDDPDREEHDKAARKAFIEEIVAAPSLDKLSEGRLSGTSRLAFHVNCQPPPDATPEETGLNPNSGAAPAAPASGGFTYPELQFTFDALTDWSRHEPAVTRRAQKLFTANPNGILPPIGERAANLTDADILAFQGLTLGPVTAEQRLGEIRSSLARKPDAFETAIELPARLTLSTAQDAVWLADRLLDENVRDEPSCATPKALTPPEKDENVVLKQGETRHSRKPLWTARLSLDGSQPDLRIVHSPDFRPLALSRLSDQIRKPGQGAPPRGPLAPWFIGSEQMDAETVTAGSLNGTLPVGTKRAEAPEVFCKPPIKDRIWRILKLLCDRDEARGQLDDWRLFRATLDAYDRHELVLLSSAYGLPVIGKRKPRDGDPPGSELPGGLVANSGQMEPGDQFPILEADDGQAVQRPQPLRASELWLSALGGSLTHDTLFYPSAGLDDLWGKKLFDGFSIERWRAEIVLGRDIVGEVVYKGYLFPLGHRASLVKLTERLFLLTKNNGVKAVLVQRIFLRVGRKSQAYPAVGQPFNGRLWCAQDVTIRTLQTPDLRDPYEPPKNGKPESPAGRIDLERGPGLAFWPRINETDEGLVKFDLTLDGAVTSMPLIFVDNIAATTEASLKKLIERYRATAEWIPRRKLALGLQNIRFAPEWKPGDCSLKTESVFVDVHARLADLDSNWTGNLGAYRTTPILEGAEQPPFYPAMRSASVRLEHVERFSGGRPNPVDVQYDGHYVRLGFSDRSGEKPANPMEIFLDLRKCVSMSMGDNGDRSGAVGRPDSDIVAIGRRKGPMGASGTIVYDASAPPTKTPVQREVAPDAELIKDLPGPDFEKLVSLAIFFDATKTSVAAPAPADPSRQLVVGTRQPPSKDEIANTLKLLQSFFSGSAKILGVVTFRELLSFLGFGSLFDSTPLLRQTLEFGSGALDSLNNGAQSVVEDIHARILVPLKTAVDKLNAQWTALDQKLRTKVGDKPSLGLADVFPEIAAGLKDLSTKLALAAAESDAIQLALDLGDIYESGRAFAAALDRIAANPLARLKEAAVGQVQQVLASFSQAVNVFTGPFAPLKAALEATLDKTAIASFIDEQLSGHADVAKDLDDVLSLTLASPNLMTLFQQTGQAMDADLTAIVNKFKDDLAIDVADFAKNGLADILDGKSAGDVIAKFIQGLQAKAKAAVKDAKEAIEAKLKNVNEQAVYIVNAELDAFLDSMVSDVTKTPAFQQMIKAADIGLFIIKAIRDAVKAIGDGKVHDALVQLDTVAGHIFGAGSGPFAQIEGSLSKGFAALQAAVDAALGEIVTVSSSDPIFIKEVLACKTYEDLVAKNTVGAKLVPELPASGKPMDALAPAVKALDAAAADLENLRKELVDSGNIDAITQALSNAGLDPSRFTELVTLSGLTVKFLVGDSPPDYGLRGDVSALYCQGVKTLVRVGAVRTLIGNVDTWKDVNRDFADRFAQYVRAVSDSAKALGAALSVALRRIDGFIVEHNKVTITGALLGGAAEGISLIPGLDAAVKSKFVTLKGNFDKAEPDIVAQLTKAINFAITVLTSSASFAGKLAPALDTNLKAVETGIADLGIDLNPESAGMHAAVGQITDAIASASKYTIITVPPKRFVDLSAASVTTDNSVDVKSFLTDLNGKYLALTGKLLDAEAAAIAEWRALQARAKGLPWTIQAALFKKVQPRIGDLAKVYGNLANARDEAFASIDSPLFSLQARRALFAQPVFKSPPPFNVDDPNVESSILKEKDRLREEVGVLTDAAGFVVPASQPKPNPVVDNLLRFVASWGGGTPDKAAPLQIADRVKALAEEVLRGEILSLIDVAAFRDAILDAVAQLVPTRAVFSYDFSSRVTEEPNASSIFQAQLGAQFVLSTRLTVDLLAAKKADFQATGTLGAFDVLLVGDFIDAVRLRFGGAKFEARGDSKPRFDVSYLDYEIGKDLEFAQELQSFLTPSNGSGVHIGPLARTLGLEAGYGINLGSIGVGEVSFFNVILDVSAELPFTQSEALFKTSLGTRLTPFTISILPFAGSGYFSIFAAADGIRGFEASFLFGGGGSLQFGPLAAQVQIQVGAFIRVLRVDGVSTTELYGTFLAAGSATIWIFHFAATLYVSLGQDAAGNVHGEATFTFSFSVGFIDYDYTITASHNEPALGKSGGGGGGGNGENFLPGSGRVQLAALMDSPVLSDVAQNAFGQADYGPSSVAKGTTKKKPATPPKSGAYSHQPTEQVADVISKAICQSEDWKVFSSYFDVALLPAE